MIDVNFQIKIGEKQLPKIEQADVDISRLDELLDEFWR